MKPSAIPLPPPVWSAFLDFLVARGWQVDREKASNIRYGRLDYRCEVMDGPERDMPTLAMLCEAMPNPEGLP